MRRDTLEKETLSFEGIEEKVVALLEEIQENIYQKALKLREEKTYTCTTYDDFQERIKDGGFFIYDWDGTSETEEQLKADTQATIRCIPDALSQDNLGTDMISGKPAVARVYIARSY